MVKLQKQFAYRYKDKEHYKHLVVIPEGTLQRIGWTEGQELEWTVSGNSLVLKSTMESEEDISEEGESE